MPTLLLRFASGWLTDGLSISKYIFKSPTCLFLLLGLGVSGVLGSLGSDSGVSLGGSGHSEGSVCVLLLGLGRDGSGLGLGSLLDNGEGSRGGEDLDGGLGLVGLTLLELSGKTISLDWYSLSRRTLASRPSTDRFCRRWSTAIPMVRA